MQPAKLDAFRLLELKYKHSMLNIEELRKQLKEEAEENARVRMELAELNSRMRGFEEEQKKDTKADDGSELTRESSIIT